MNIAIVWVLWSANSGTQTIKNPSLNLTKKRGKTMKRFSKITLSVAAVSVLTTAMAISASAMTANYNNGTVTLADVTATGASQTLLVLDTVNLQTVAAENIKQIDQKDDGTSFAAVTVGTLADGTYEVRVGGDGTIQTATFTVGGTTVVTKDITVGDINLDGALKGNDLTAIKRAQADLATGTGKYGTTYTVAEPVANKLIVNDIYTVGDINLDKALKGNDLTAVKRAQADLATGTGYYGTTIKVIAE